MKIDEHLSEKHSIAGSVFIGGYSNSNNGGLNLLDSSTTNSPTTQIRFTYNYTHSPTLVNNLNFGFIRDTGFSGPLQAGPGLAALGIQGFLRLQRQSFSEHRDRHGARTALALQVHRLTLKTATLSVIT